MLHFAIKLHADSKPELALPFHYQSRTLPKTFEKSSLFYYSEKLIRGEQGRDGMDKVKR